MQSGASLPQRAGDSSKIPARAGEAIAQAVKTNEARSGRATCAADVATRHAMFAVCKKTCRIYPALARMGENEV